MEREDPIPKLNHLLTGVDNFARWYQGLRLYLDMKDFDEYGEYSYWDIVDGKMTEWDEGAITENDSISYRKWRKANAFILLTIRKNSEEGPFRLVGLCNTGAEALKIPRTHYENKSEADLGIALTKVTTMTYKEDTQIDTHIEEFEKRWEKMTTIASGSLKPAYVEAGKILQKMGHNELLKKELLLATLPTGIMRYAQLVQNTRKDDNSYGDVISQLKQYVPSLAWKKKEDRQHTPGREQNPITVNQNRYQPPTMKSIPTNLEGYRKGEGQNPESQKIY